MAADDPFPEHLEGADSVAPSNLGFKHDDGRATAPFYLKSITSYADFQQRILSILGYNLEGNDGRIHRVLPRAFGLTSFLHASDVNLVGYGVPGVASALPPQADDPGESPLAQLRAAADAIARIRTVYPRTMADEYALCPNFTANVSFQQRPYEVIPDTEIGVYDSTYFDEAGNQRGYRFANEWQRYTEVDERYESKIITATQGQLTFRTGDGTQPDGQAFAGTPRIPFPESVLTLTWHQVPYRYLSSSRSYLKRLRNYVNQNEFEIQGYRFQPGELLFLDATYTRYTPPFPFENRDLGRFALEKWVDLKLMFGVAKRPVLNPPRLKNPNWITQHWNALPWFGPGNFSTPRRRYHYVCSFHPLAPKNPAYWQPLFESAPIPELLFTDPDAPQPDTFGFA